MEELAFFDGQLERKLEIGAIAEWPACLITQFVTRRWRRKLNKQFWTKNRLIRIQSKIYPGRILKIWAGEFNLSLTGVITLENAAALFVVSKPNSPKKNENLMRLGPRPDKFG
jgi:hypothetical protein